MKENTLFHKIGPGECWAFGAALSYAATNVMLKWALADAPPLFGAAIKIMPVWILSFMMVVLKGQHRDLSPRSKSFVGWKAMGLNMTLGALYYVIGNGALFEALKRGGVVLATPIVGTQVIWAALFAYIFLREKINLPMMMGMVTSIIGVTVLTIGKSGTGISLEGWQLAVPLAALAALCFSSGGAIQRYLFTIKKLDRWMVMFVGLTAGELLLHLIFLFQNNLGYYTAISLNTIGKFLLAGIIGASAIICITTAMSQTAVASAITINSTQTALAPLIAFFALGESMNKIISLGILLIMMGAMIVQLKKPKEQNEISKEA